MGSIVWDQKINCTQEFTDEVKSESKAREFICIYNSNLIGGVETEVDQLIRVKWGSS